MITSGETQVFFLQQDILPKQQASLFIPDGSYFAATYSKQRARVWWTDSCRLKTILADESGRPESDLCSIKFSPDGSTIAAASSDATVKVWNISESSKPRILNGHTQAVTCLSFHPNGEILVAASRSGAILKWNLFSGQELLSPVDNEHSISAVSFHLPAVVYWLILLRTLLLN